MGSYLPHLKPLTHRHTMLAALLWMSLVGHGHGFFFRYSIRVASDNHTEYFEERRNFTKPRDAITGITQGIGDAIQGFEPGLTDLEDNTTDLRRKDITDTESDEKDPSLGSTVVVGLFDSLRQFTKQVGKLVSVVGDRMDDRRGDVVRIADNVDTQVHNLGQGIRDWKIKTFGLKEKRKETMKEEEDLGEDIIVVKSGNSSDEEEFYDDTTISPLLV